MGHNSPTSWAFLVPPTSPRLPQEQRKHFDESDAAAARDAAAAERSAAVAERRRRKSHVEANGLGEALESLPGCRCS